MTILFPDVSHYQAGLSLAGAPAVIAKATQGTGFVDVSYLDFKAQAAKLGIPFCAYHWVDGSDVAAQARHAYSVVGSTPMMWDAEAPGATVARLMDLTALYRSLGGVVHLVYLPRWWWADLSGPSLTPLAAAGLALVSSNYPTTGYAPNGRGWDAYGGVTPTQWQYSDAHPFGGQRVDFNAFNGTAAEWAALISGDDAMTPQQAYIQHVMNYRLDGLLHNRPTVTVPAFASGTLAVPANTETNDLAARLAMGGPGGVDLAPILAVLAELRAEVTALRSQLAAGAQAEAAALATPQG